MITGLDRTYHDYHFIFSFTFYLFVYSVCNTGWLLVSFSLDVKYTLSYRIVSYNNNNNNNNRVQKKKKIIIIITTSVSETIRKPPFVKAQTAFKNKNKIKYGEKRFLIWRMELLQPAMWQVALG